MALLKPGSRPPFAERNFTGCVFGDVFFELFTPQGLKGPAAAIQRLDFGEIGKFAQQITKINFTGGHTRVFGHISPFNDPTFGFWIISSDGVTKKINIEHRTLNIQHRIMYSINFKSKQGEATARNLSGRILRSLSRV